MKTKDRVSKILNLLRFPNTSLTEEKVAQYEESLAANPKQKDALMNLGRLYHRSFKFQKAIECKLKASKLDPTDPNVKFSLGCSYTAAGEIDNAIKSYSDALQLNPGLVEAWEALADQFFILGKEGKAQECLEKAEMIKFRGIM